MVTRSGLLKEHGKHVSFYSLLNLGSTCAVALRDSGISSATEDTLLQLYTEVNICHLCR